MIFCDEISVALFDNDNRVGVWRRLGDRNIVARVVVQAPRAARPYLFSDGQNMYSRVVLEAIY